MAQAQGTSQAPALAEPTKEKDRPRLLDLLQDERTINAFKAVATEYLPPERMLKICVNAVRKTPRLAECDPRSVLGSMMFFQSLGLEPNTPRGLAWLIPYAVYEYNRETRKRELVRYDCQPQIGYPGYVALAHRSPKIVTLDADAIREGDTFDHEKGSGAFLRYKKALSNRGDLLGSFCYIKFKTEHAEGEVAAVLPRDEIEKIRARSEAWRYVTRKVAEAQTEAAKRYWEGQLAETPWVMWEDDMAAKSAIKKLCKRLPIESTMVYAGEVESASEAGVLDLEALADPDVANAVAAGEQSPPVKEGPPDEGEESERPTAAAPQEEQKPKSQSRGGRKRSTRAEAARKEEAGAEAQAEDRKEEPEAGRAEPRDEPVQEQPSEAQEAEDTSEPAEEAEEGETSGDEAGGEQAGLGLDEEEFE